MTKKDYVMIANVLNGWVFKYTNDEFGIYKRSASHPEANNILEAFCIEFKKENPRFDAKKFIEACTK